MDIKFIPVPQVSNNDNFINFKVLIIGNSGVGKNEILRRALNKGFDENYPAEIGLEFLIMHFIVNDFKMKLQIWDTCGQELYSSLVQGFYRNSSLALLVYDISDKKSFEGLDIYLEIIREKTDPDMPIFIIGNNCDLERQVTFDEAKEFSVSRKVKYFIECSAKTGYNIEKIFYEAAKYLYSSYKESDKKYISSNKLKIGPDYNKENNLKKSLINKFFNNKLKIGKENNEDNTCKKLEKNIITSEFSSNYILNKYSIF